MERDWWDRVLKPYYTDTRGPELVGFLSRYGIAETDGKAMVSGCLEHPDDRAPLRMLNTMERLFTLAEHIAEIPHGRAMRIFLLVLCVDSMDKLRTDSRGACEQCLRDTMADFVNNWLVPDDRRLLSHRIEVEDDCGIYVPSTPSQLVDILYAVRNAYAHEADGTLFPFSNDGITRFGQTLSVGRKSPKDIHLGVSLTFDELKAVFFRGCYAFLLQALADPGALA